jgi:hypothetical protein
MKDRFLVCDVGWMDEYDGLKGDNIHSTAGFVKRKKWEKKSIILVSTKDAFTEDYSRDE